MYKRQNWDPANKSGNPAYGILPMILTSVYGTAGAIVIGVPIDVYKRQVVESSSVRLRFDTSAATSWLVVLTLAELTQRTMEPRFWPAMPPV